MRKPILLALLLIAAKTPTASAASNEGAGAFAIRSGSARGAVLGEAYAAVGGDADAIMWNPAALATVESTHFQATYNDIFSLGLARHTSLSLAGRPSSEEIVVRGDSIAVVASTDERPVYAASMSVLVVDIGDENYWEFAPTVGFATRVAAGTAFGAAARYLRASSSLTGVSATGYAFDAGVTQRFPLNTTVGVAFRNLLGQLKWKEGREETEPRELILAAAWRIAGRAALLAGAATDLDDDLSDRWNLATEIDALPGRWTLMVGVESRRDGDDMSTRAAAGTALRVGQVRFDYAFVAQGDTPGDTHRATLMVIL